MKIYFDYRQKMIFMEDERNEQFYTRLWSETYRISFNSTVSAARILQIRCKSSEVSDFFSRNRAPNLKILEKEKRKLRIPSPDVKIHKFSKKTRTELHQVSYLPQFEAPKSKKFTPFPIYLRNPRSYELKLLEIGAKILRNQGK